MKMPLAPIETGTCEPPTRRGGKPDSKLPQGCFARSGQHVSAFAPFQPMPGNAMIVKTHRQFSGGVIVAGTGKTEMIGSGGAEPRRILRRQVLRRHLKQSFQCGRRLRPAEAEVAVPA